MEKLNKIEREAQDKEIIFQGHLIPCVTHAHKMPLRPLISERAWTFARTARFFFGLPRVSPCLSLHFGEPRQYFMAIAQCVAGSWALLLSPNHLPSLRCPGTDCVGTSLLPLGTRSHVPTLSACVVVRQGVAGRFEWGKLSGYQNKAERCRTLI